MDVLNLALKVAAPELIDAFLEGAAAEEAALLVRIGWPLLSLVLRAIGKGLHKALCARRRRAVPVERGPVSPCGLGSVCEGAEGEAADRRRE
ncbi:hypothetical protein ACWDD9_42595 [Kitasatospora sp. NPDC001119]